MRGYFITFEGGDGSGKSTQILRLTLRLQESGRSVVQTREPGGCWLAERIRDILVAEHGHIISPEAELLLFAAARVEHLNQVIRPALARGDWVICDRFHDSTTAYQGYGRGLELARIHEVHGWVIGTTQPDLTVLLDLDPEKGLARSHGRGHGGLRFENEAMAFHQRVREGFRRLAEMEPDRIRLLQADADPSAIHEQIWQVVMDVCPSV